MLQKHVKEINWWKNTEVWVETMIELKKLFRKLQTIEKTKKVKIQ